MSMRFKPESEWNDDCMKHHGRTLIGKKAHWCWDWDCMPIDETTPEIDGCACEIGMGRPKHLTEQEASHE